MLIALHHRRPAGRSCGSPRCRCAPRRDLRQPLCAADDLHWSKFADAWIGSNYGTYFWNSRIVVVSAVVARHRDRRHGRPLPRPLPLPRQPLRPLPHPVRHDPAAAAPHPLAVPDHADFGLYNSLLGLVARLRRDPARDDGLHPRGLLRADSAGPVRRGADGRLLASLEIFWRITLPIGLPALFTTAMLNFIILWNEFLYAVVLLTDDDKRTLPLGIMHFMGGHQLDVGMVATGLMIAIAAGRPHLRALLRHDDPGHDRRRRALGLGTAVGDGHARAAHQALRRRRARRPGPRLAVADGEFVVLLGPSGCGKSTALRMIAGLEPITSGTISIDGRVVNDVPAKDRDIAMVFQSYALYPHMSVCENIAFGLRRRAGRRAPRSSAGCAAAAEQARPRRLPRAASRTRSPAASGSAWRWAAPSSAIPRCSCSTSRSPTSTPRCASRRATS